MGDFIRIEKKGRVAILTINRPDSLNAVGTLEDCHDLAAAIAGLDSDSSISAAVLTGSGRAFCSGGNLMGMKNRDGIGRRDEPIATAEVYRAGIHAFVRAFMASDVPIIAAVNGHAIGLGCNIACLCDLRIAGESARFAASYVKVGIVPGDGGAWPLEQAVGYATAAELLLTGERIDADRAKDIGLVSRAVPDDRLLDEAMALAEKIAANPPQAVRLNKRMLRQARQQRQEDHLELAAATQAIIHETADHDEAVAAFLEKREPRFSGS